MYADDLHITGQGAVIKAVVERIHRAPDGLAAEVLAGGRHVQTFDQRAESSRDSGARTEAAPLGRTVKIWAHDVQTSDQRAESSRDSGARTEAAPLGRTVEFRDPSRESAESLDSIESSSQATDSPDR